jgi:hypothetical protein
MIANCKLFINELIYGIVIDEEGRTSHCTTPVYASTPISQSKIGSAGYALKLIN